MTGPSDPLHGDGSPSHSDDSDAGLRHEVELAHWRRLTTGDDLQGIALRLDEDPELQLAGRVVNRMRAEAVMLDLDRLMMAVCGRLILHASEYAGDLSLVEWIDRRIDESIADLINEDAIEQQEGRPVHREDRRYLRLALSLGTDARTFRRGSVVFHRLPHRERTAFWAVFVDGSTIEEHARAVGVPLRVAQGRLNRVVSSFCTLGASRGLGGSNAKDERGEDLQ